MRPDPRIPDGDLAAQTRPRFRPSVPLVSKELKTKPLSTTTTLALRFHIRQRSQTGQLKPGSIRLSAR